MDEQVARWSVDLTNLEANARWFDPVTRTYRVQLDLPAWTGAGDDGVDAIAGGVCAADEGRDGGDAAA